MGFLIHNNIVYTERKDIKLPYTSELEAIFIEIRTKHGSTIIGSMYSPPHTKEKQFLCDYKQLIDIINKEAGRLFMQSCCFVFVGIFFFL